MLRREEKGIEGRKEMWRKRKGEHSRKYGKNKWRGSKRKGWEGNEGKKGKEGRKIERRIRNKIRNKLHCYLILALINGNNQCDHF